VSEEDVEVFGRELELLVTVHARAPELAIAVGPRDPLSVA
jgi:hypothetical protein